MTKKKQPLKCYNCEQPIKFGTGATKKVRYNLDGSKHECDPAKSKLRYDPPEREITGVKTNCPDCHAPVLRKGVALYDDNDAKVDHVCKYEEEYQQIRDEPTGPIRKIIDKRPADHPAFQRADKHPIRPVLRVKKIIVSRTLSINYGVAREYAVEKEALLNSFTLGMEAETDADLNQAELVTRDLINQVNFITKTEFTEKTVLRLLKNDR
jgi:hypothetical protein